MNKIYCQNTLNKIGGWLCLSLLFKSRLLSFSIKDNLLLVFHVHLQLLYRRVSFANGES